MSIAERAAIEGWVAAYRHAWETDDPDDVAALFTEDATYSPGPFSKPWEGRETIVAEWVKRGDSDAVWAFEHEILATDGPMGVIQGLTTYAATDTNPETVYGNIWIVVLEPNGRASSFAEWWMQRPKPECAASAP